MILKEDIKPITYLKSNASSVLEYINSTQRTMVITQNGEAKAVLQDPDTYDKTQQALALLKVISQSENSIKSGKGISQENVFSSLKEKLDALQ
jgi:prevent-host-death family protein